MRIVPKGRRRRRGRRKKRKGERKKGEGKGRKGSHGLRTKVEIFGGKGRQEATNSLDVVLGAKVAELGHSRRSFLFSKGPLVLPSRPLAAVLCAGGKRRNEGKKK